MQALPSSALRVAGSTPVPDAHLTEVEVSAYSGVVLVRLSGDAEREVVILRSLFASPAETRQNKTEGE